jgi:hypothetical protein
MTDLYKERKKLVREGSYLRSLAMSKNITQEKCFEIRKFQNQQYKKYQFLDGFIKAKEKMEANNNV